MTDAPLQAVYSAAYFDEMEAEVARSAEVVVPLLLELVQPASAIDIGCGRGTWLSVLRRHGVARIRGVDGAHVLRESLQIAPEEFLAADISQPLQVGGDYDLALCLEVLEHLPAAAGEAVVKQLVELAPAVLFSAAVPGQGGVEHVNEQWPEYWESLFDRHGFVRLDPFRRVVCYDMRVKWWYRQNLFLYASPELVAGDVGLQREAEFARDLGLEWVHTSVLSHYLRERTFRGLVEALPGAFRASLQKRRRRRS